jgi:alanyl-tRNA synthetase
VRTTGQIGLFHITSETGIAAGVRRIEAATGPGAYSYVKGMESHLSEAAERLRTGPEHVPNKIEALLDEKKKLEKQVEELIRGGSAGSRGNGESHDVAGVTVLVDESPVSDRAQVGLLMDAFREKNRKGIKVVFTTGERPSIFVAVTDDLVSSGVKAGELANELAAISGGRGGGRPHFASSGVGDVEKLPETKSRVVEIVRACLASRGLA